MNKIILNLSIFITIVALTGCSLAPGIPGLEIDSSRNGKPQKEGVDYKLVIIDAETIKKQKPFDFAAYIKTKKQRAFLYNSQASKTEDSNGVRESLANNKSRLEPTKKDRPLSRVNNTRIRQQDAYSSSANVLSRFEGITANDNKSNYQYYIGKGDVLNITVWDHPELTTPSENNAFGGHIVGSDGYFYFPNAGKIRALGKTIRIIRDELESKLGSFITKPQVSVSIANYRSQKVYTSGAIVSPSTLVISDTPTTVRDAISSSGGLKPNQYTGYAELYRNGKNISIDLNRMLRYNDNRQNFILKNGDRLNIVERSELDEFNRKLNLDVRKENTISAVRLRNEIKSIDKLNPVKLKYALERERAIARLKKELERELRSEQAKVFVMGEVYKPGSVKYQLEDGMTLAEAINEAGSFKEDSVNPKGIFLVRKEAENDKIPTVYQLPMSTVQSIFLAEEFNVRPRDVVYVTATPSIRWNRVLAQLLPSLAIVNTFRNFK